MDIIHEILEVKSMQGQILQIIKDSKTEITETKQDLINLKKIIIGNGNPESSIIFRLQKVENTEKNCIITQIKDKITLVIITAIASAIVGIINIIGTYFMNFTNIFKG